MSHKCECATDLEAAETHLEIERAILRDTVRELNEYKKAVREFLESPRRTLARAIAKDNLRRLLNRT